MRVVVLHTTAPSEHIRGYTSRFLQQAQTGLYVGTVSQKVADALWEQLIASDVEGEMFMLITSPHTENGWVVRTHNTSAYRVRDYDGIYLPTRIHHVSKAL